ncbi:MAG: nucleotide exchange factor GrpE [Oscillospiraceae bacterium]|nr:nucleotide exchange factor GrpE [Oscillospiraceae bacterium]
MIDEELDRTEFPESVELDDPTVDNVSDAEATEDNAGEAVPEKDEVAEMKEQLLRTMAEYDNFRKRTAREKEALRAEIITGVVSKFLPVMDNLERALSADCSDDNYKSGVKMIYDSFMETLSGLGVEEIQSDGAPFDPNLHQAVHRIEDPEKESGTVVQTFAKGYKIGEKVIRFAMVAVVS